MRRQATRDTAPEVKLRRHLHADGYRYRVHMRPLPDLRRTADIVFPRAKVAVFVDGCFWHSCPEHRTSPKTNADWWSEKLERNRERDLETNRRLQEAGWSVVRIWEHEDPRLAAERVKAVIASQIA